MSCRLICFIRTSKQQPSSITATHNIKQQAAIHVYCSQRYSPHNQAGVSCAALTAIDTPTQTGSHHIHQPQRRRPNSPGRRLLVHQLEWLRPPGAARTGRPQMLTAVWNVHETRCYQQQQPLSVASQTAGRHPCIHHTPAQGTLFAFTLQYPAAAYTSRLLYLLKKTRACINAHIQKRVTTTHLDLAGHWTHTELTAAHMHTLPWALRSLQASSPAHGRSTESTGFLLVQHRY